MKRLQHFLIFMILYIVTIHSVGYAAIGINKFFPQPKLDFYLVVSLANMLAIVLTMFDKLPLYDLASRIQNRIFKP